jgi:hypothetical protein
MGNFWKVRKLTTKAEITFSVLILAVVGAGVWFFAPGEKAEDATTLNALVVDGGDVDNVMTTAEFKVPTSTPSLAVKDKPLVTIAGYAWDCEMPIITANGGPRTTKGSLMEMNGVNLNIVRQDWLSELKTMQLKFIDQYHNGQEYPTSDRAAFAVMIMGDGAP